MNEFHLWRNRGNPHSSEKRGVFLSMMTSGGFYRQVGHIFGLTKSSVLEYTHEVADFMYGTAQQWIRLPNHEEFERLGSELVLNNGEVKKAVLYIDGSIVRIMRPDHANDSYYCGRPGKSCDSINVQFVTDKFGYVRHIVTGFSGKKHTLTCNIITCNMLTCNDNTCDTIRRVGRPTHVYVNVVYY